MMPTVCAPATQGDSSIPITVLVKAQPDTDVGGRAYHVAGQRVVTDLRTPWLEALLLDREPTTMAVPQRPASLDAVEAYTTVFEGVDTIGRRQVEVSCRLYGDVHFVRVGGIGEFAVTAGGDAVICLRCAPHAEPDDVVLASLGAPFLIACAQRNTWALHASAVATRYGAAAFAAESGAGKSTLAQYLATVENDAFKFVSDDVLPVAVEAGRPYAHADYPQFKLPATQQPSTTLSGTALPLRALFILAQPASAADEVAVTLLRAGESALAIASHTVASRLFGRSLLARHLLFCTEAANVLPVYLLSYPQRRDALPSVRDAVENVVRLA